MFACPTKHRRADMLIVGTLSSIANKVKAFGNCIKEIAVKIIKPQSLLTKIKHCCYFTTCAFEMERSFSSKSTHIHSSHQQGWKKCETSLEYGQKLHYIYFSFSEIYSIIWHDSCNDILFSIISVMSRHYKSQSMLSLPIHNSMSYQWTSHLDSDLHNKQCLSL